MLSSPHILTAKCLSWKTTIVLRKNDHKQGLKNYHQHPIDTNLRDLCKEYLLLCAFNMVVIITSDQMLRQGLRIVGFNTERIQNVSLDANLERFRAHYGSYPIVYAAIWEDLHHSTFPDARIDDKADLVSYLMAIFFLKCYPSEAQLAGTFRVCERTVRKWCWYYAGKIQALKQEKVIVAMLPLPAYR
jgi:hypothetical protein